MQQRVLYAPRQPSPPGPDVAGDLPRYRKWAAERDAFRAGVALPPLSGSDVLELFLVLRDPEPEGLRRCLRSLAGQTTRHWRLAVVCGPQLPRRLRSLVHRELWRRHGHLRVLDDEAVEDEAVAAQRALDTSTAPLIAFMGWQDQLAPDAVALLLQTAKDADLAYGDEDSLDPDGQLVDPMLKPDWSPELLLGSPYLGRPVVVRRALAEAAGGFRSMPDGSWEHDFMLRVTERASIVAHLREVVLHRGPPTACPGGSTAVDEALRRRREPASVVAGRLERTWFVRRDPEPTTVSVVVPFRDGPRFLRTCVDSVRATCSGLPVQLVLVDNGSEDPETITLIERLAGSFDVSVLRDPRPFNWAAINNAAVAAAAGEVLLFLNNDIEAGTPGWLQALLGQVQRPEVGVVGARLLYPGGSVQHAGIVVGLGGAAGHVFAGLPADEPGYLGMAVRTREVSAVTGACLATRRSVFEELGGFDEGLGLDLNDVDYCLRAQQAGYRVVYEPAAELVHYESPTRGTSGSAADIRCFVERWEGLLAAGDPFLNTALSRADPWCSLSRPGEEAEWDQWRSTLPTA
ncbi:MAG: glycosyltransferase [Acidimicrobiales bacterium]